jgi:serine/threonine protein kinase
MVSDTLIEIPGLSIKWSSGANDQIVLALTEADGVEITHLAKTQLAEELPVLGVFEAFVGDEFYLVRLRARPRRIESVLGNAHFAEHDVWALLKDLAMALDAMHRSGFVLGFLRADSLLWLDRKTCLLPDWFLVWQSAPIKILAKRLPQLAPEFLREESLSPSTDQFLLACVAFQLLYGVHPFSGSSAIEEALRLDMGQRVKTSERDIGIESVWDRALHSQTEYRYQTCEEFVRSLENSWRDSKNSGYSGTVVGIDETIFGEAGAGDALSSGKSSTIKSLWLGASTLAIMSLALGVWTSTLTRKLDIEVQQAGSTANGNDSVSANQELVNGSFSVCNSSSEPIQISELSAVYRVGSSIGSFDSTQYKTDWLVAPSSRQSLTFAPAGGVLWDGSVLF